MLHSMVYDANGVALPSIGKVAGALAKAQGEFLAIHKSKTVMVNSPKGSYEFAYAPLEVILAAVRPALVKNELALTQSVIFAKSQDEGDLLRTWLIHSSGEFLACDTPLIVGQGAGPQAYGSAETYARRYGVTKLLNLAADDDDDANAAEGNAVTVKRGKASKAAASGAGPVTITAKQATELTEKMKKAGADPALFAKFLGETNLEDWSQLPAAKFQKAVAALDAKIAKAAKPLGPPMTEPFSGGEPTPEELDAKRAVGGAP